MNTRKAALRVCSIFIKVSIFILICLGLVFLGKITYQYTHAVFQDKALEAEPGRNIKITIPEDVSTKEFAKVLEEKGLIYDAEVFLIQMKIEGFGDTVKAGKYKLNTSMAPTEMIRILSENDKDET